jgi:Cell wall-associated hydrolases (invasion-associated proteins)
MSLNVNTLYQEKYQQDNRSYFKDEFEMVNCRINLANYYMVDAPDYFANRISEVLYGERFNVIKTHNEWSFICLEVDGYCGWIPTAIVRRVFTNQEQLNQVVTRITNVFSRASEKSAVVQRLRYGSKVFVDSKYGNNGFVYSAELDGWIFREHLDCDTRKHNDEPFNYVSFSSKIDHLISVFLHSPYVFGGRSSHGFDCSGFVQMLFQSAHVLLPRDSDMQQDYGMLHQYVPVDLSHVIFGDLIFWQGHVAIAIDNQALIHSTSYSMSVCIRKNFNSHR